MKIPAFLQQFPLRRHGLSRISALAAGLTLALCLACENDNTNAETKTTDQEDEESEKGEDEGGEACGFECSPSKQDCGKGQKCSPWRCEEGCCTDSNHCVEVYGDKQDGEDCERDASSGNDDCAKGLFCKPLNKSSGESGEGVCQVLCTPVSEGGEPDECDKLNHPGEYCFNFNGGSFPTCRQTCDPLKQDCENELQGCYIAVDNYYCSMTLEEFPDGSMGLPGDMCETEQGCQKGNGCAPQELLEDCVADCANSSAVCGCCAAFCDSRKGDKDCTGEGERCEPLFPKTLDVEHVGICTTKSR